MTTSAPAGTSFVRRVVTIGPGGSRPYDEAEWRDALVVVVRGEVDLECHLGGRRRFGAGTVLWLDEIPLVALHNPDSTNSVIVTITRAGSVAGMTAPPSRPVRIGVQLQPQHAEYRDLRRAVGAAEEAGVDVAFNWDHFYPLYGESDGKHFECYTVLAAWAEQTDRIQLGALVTCNSYRNPELLADMARTIDHVSEGRFILGIGSGWFERDYTEYGYEFGTAGGRIDALGEALPRIESRWAQLNPAPTRKIPVLIGGGGERKTLRLVAKHADIWHGFGDAETIAHKHNVLDEWCAKVGRDPSEIERSAAVGGDPADTGDTLYDVGTRLFTVDLNGPDYDLAPVQDWLAFRDDKNART